MRILLFLFIASFALSVSCKNGDPDKDHQRIVFDLGSLKFISTSLNTKSESMSALYGNPKAFQSLSDENNQPEAGSVLKLVTWQYHDNPQYIGGTITGELLKVETITIDRNKIVSYERRTATQTEKNPSNKEERIHYIMSYKPVTRP